ncbi:MAG: hypothetical protein GC159_02795 [Phycisphaera sp.]|nr:hypothetical protein [Phycisphaera sp.]
MANDRTTVVNIISLSYSGSTWVNLMLGSHPESFSVGEMKSISKIGWASCTIHGDECPVWSKFDHEHIDTKNPFDQLREITGKRVFIVNNSRDFLPFMKPDHIDAKFVHLIRDGRAVAASFLRKYPDKSMWGTAKLIAHDLRRNLRLIGRQPKADTMTLIYEQAMADKQGALKQLCGFTGLDYRPEMEAFWDVEQHFLGGNRGTLTSMIQKGKEQKDELPTWIREKRGDENLPQWNTEFYKDKDPGNFVDERWKDELTDSQLRVFALLAGRLNRRFGYPKALDRS